MNARLRPRNGHDGRAADGGAPVMSVYEPKNGTQKSGGPTQSPGPSGCAAAQPDNTTPAAIAKSVIRAERASNGRSFIDGE
ncbi:hypothetical protein [Burkholderia sp. BCC0397]|uniref:hypothetical protein n=1 Tax=Burkholderia sp. BCC0397 TaxID=486876 RepID=UPI00158B45A4|nr:hypothetical protein [Burkholderia sp. BCC0397]